MNTVLLEIRAAEGGDDAKDLVLDQLDIYLCFAARAAREQEGRREL